MIEFNFREELIENDRFYIGKAAREDTTSTVIGECAMCGADIHEGDDEYLINDNARLGLCRKCLNKCHYK